VVAAVVPAFSHWAKRVPENMVPEKIKKRTIASFIFMNRA
jgi:hypothetical protein